MFSWIRPWSCWGGVRGFGEAERRKEDCEFSEAGIYFFHQLNGIFACSIGNGIRRKYAWHGNERDTHIIRMRLKSHFAQPIFLYKCSLDFVMTTEPDSALILDCEVIQSRRKMWIFSLMISISLEFYKIPSHSSQQPTAQRRFGCIMVMEQFRHFWTSKPKWMVLL